MIFLSRSCFLAVGLVVLGFAGCKVKYSFTGASVAPDVQTISIITFPADRDPLAPPSLGQSFTEALKDKYLRQTNLTLVKTGGDLSIDGEIIGYRQTDEAAVGNVASTTSLSKLTITVRVNFVDTKHPENSFEETFSNFELFAATRTLAEAEAELIEQINEKLTQDIFNRTLGNW